MSDLPFVHTDGMLTVEEIKQPSWIVRCRIHDKSMMAPYDWVVTFVKVAPGVCEIKGFGGRRVLTPNERHALKRIGIFLKFYVGRYERFDENGEFKGMVEIWDESKKVTEK